MCQELNEKLIRTEAEHRGLQDQLFTRERLAIELNEQLKLHQDNFSKLRDELENTVLQQAELNDGYSREMGQIENVLLSFQRDPTLVNSPPTHTVRNNSLCVVITCWLQVIIFRNSHNRSNSC